MPRRFPYPAILAAVGLFLVPAAQADGPTRKQVACMLALNAAGAHVAAVSVAAATRCVRDACGDKLPGGETADQCLAADRGGAVGRAKQRTVAIAGRKCREAPPFGPQNAQEVNDAFAAPPRLRAVFGPELASVLKTTATDRAAAGCQVAIAKGLALVTLAELREFNRCKQFKLRHHAMSALPLQTCIGVDTGRLGQARKAAQALVSRRCSGVALASAAPGECAAAAPADFVACVATRYCGDRPVTTQSVARQWNEETLAAIRRDNPRPPVHARNLFHVSVAIYDAWAAYDATAKPYLTHERATSTDVERDRAIAISFAAYRVLSERYSPDLALNAGASQMSFDARMNALGLDKTFTDTAGSGPAALGNRFAAAVIAFGKTDGSNEDENYADPTYTPVNQPLIVKTPDIDFATVVDPNRWQPLALDQMIGQNGVPLPGKVQTFVGSQWGDVTPFALTRASPTDLYLDPGPQPQLTGLGGATDLTFKAQVQQVIELSSRLTPDDPTMIDISPASLGNNPLGTNDGHGYPVNPATGQPYTPEFVKRGDFGRLIAEYWADGPTSETPPGHWNVLANSVADTPGFERRFRGTGPVLDPLEWDVKTYLALNGAEHDAAIACWGAKRKYDGVRPITMIRYMGKKGQSSDSGQASFDPMGLLLEPGVIEVITAESSAPGQRHADLVAAGAQLGDIAIVAWPGGPADPKTQHSGTRWVLAKGWVPYQRATFVTPAFPGYFSGHSTYSRSAAEVLTLLTGSEFFPGGLGEFVVRQNGFLQFEAGPSEDVTLQWARYFDAADQAGQSRLWGGIHVEADDFTGRRVGDQVGIAAFNEAVTYFDGTAAP
ncbi:MAG: vanadium-dependent haloperoxidase [Deltaproteobacteria bacterium]|nr:MAG: vanadium-dependent haloperoxidase [Deltaproteobacteria bacterium]